MPSHTHISIRFGAAIALTILLSYGEAKRGNRRSEIERKKEGEDRSSQTDRRTEDGRRTSKDLRNHSHKTSALGEWEWDPKKQM